MEERPAEEPQTDTDDLSGAEYLSRNDREKMHGYNRLPHRPIKPLRDKQLREVRSGERQRRESDAG